MSLIFSHFVGVVAVGGMQDELAENGRLVRAWRFARTFLKNCRGIGIREFQAMLHNRFVFLWRVSAEPFLRGLLKNSLDGVRGRAGQLTP